MKLIKQLWNGDVALAKTYWLYYFAGGWLFGIAIFSLQYFVIPIARIAGKSPIYLLLGAALVYSLFTSVAVWRSANAYTGQKRWRVLAKTAIVVGLAGMAANLALMYMENKQPSEQAVAEVARALRRNLPVMADNNVQLHDVTADGRRLTFHHRIIGLDPSAINAATFSERMYKLLVSRTCNDKNMVRHLRKGLTIAYRYETSDYAEVAHFTIGSRDCSN